MAAPTINYLKAEAGTNASLVSVFMPNLHTKLLAAGWTLEYADADAIGSGSSATPAWDKTPGVSAEAGTVVYRMPANGHATQWFVLITPAWGMSNTNRPHFKSVTVGTAHAAGVISGVSTTVTPTNNTTSSTTKDSGHRVCTSEDGFAALLDTGTNIPSVVVERGRKADGSTDDALVILMTGFNTAGAVIAAGGVINAASPMKLVTGIRSAVSMPSLSNNDNSQLLLMGPYWLGGFPLLGPSRHLVLASNADVDADELFAVSVDGGLKTFVGTTGTWGATDGRYAVATE